MNQSALKRRDHRLRPVLALTFSRIRITLTLRPTVDSVMLRLEAISLLLFP